MNESIYVGVVLIFLGVLLYLTHLVPLFAGMILGGGLVFLLYGLFEDGAQ